MRMLSSCWGDIGWFPEPQRQAGSTAGSFCLLHKGFILNLKGSLKITWWSKMKIKLMVSVLSKLFSSLANKNSVHPSTANLAFMLGLPDPSGWAANALVWVWAGLSSICIHLHSHTYAYWLSPPMGGLSVLLRMNAQIQIKPWLLPVASVCVTGKILYDSWSRNEFSSLLTSPAGYFKP